MAQNNSQNYDLIDIFKLIFSLCIVALHVGLNSCLDETANWYTVHLIFRLAVPFFFMVSGFFYGRMILQENTDVKQKSGTYISRLLFPLTFWLLVSLPFEILNLYNSDTWNGISQTIIILIKKILFYPWGALWYLHAIIVAVFILQFFYARKNYYLPVILGAILYSFALISNSYYYAVQDNQFLSKVVNTYMNIFISSRNGIFVGFLYISLGVLLAKLTQEERILKIRYNIPLLLLSYFILFIEVKILRNKTAFEDHSLFIIMPVLSFLLVMLILNHKSNGRHILLRNMSTFIYLSHRPLINIVLLSIPIIKRLYKIDTVIELFIAVTAFSIVLFFILNQSQSKFVKRIMLK